MSYDMENLYIVRAKADTEQSAAEMLGELEAILSSHGKAQLERVIRPISAAVAFIYDNELLDYLKESGYELTPQKSEKMIEWWGG